MLFSIQQAYETKICLSLRFTVKNSKVYAINLVS